MKEYIGYHGTTKKNGQDILAAKKFRLSGTNRDWLGRGVYFFEGDRHQAYMFVKYKQGRVLEDDKICVLKSKIVVEEERILDLITDDDRKFLHEYRVAIEDKLDEMSRKMGCWEYREGFVIDHMIENSTGKLDLIRAMYIIPRKSVQYKDYGFANAQIQLCVKNERCIEGKSIEEVNCNDYRRNEKRDIG